MKRLLALIGGLVFALPVLGQQPLTFAIATRPAAPGVPALKHSLLPELKDLRSGNALTRYYKSFSPEWWGFVQRQNGQWWDDCDKALETSIDKLPEAYRFATSWHMLKEADRGARLDHCDWDLLPQLKQDGFMTLLPDVQSMRSIARFLALRARYEIAEGQLDKAMYTLQTGFAMSRHIADGPTLIHMLVGVAINQLITRQLDELLSHPNCPNLYWALARLPQPFIDIRRPLEAEMLMTDQLFPDIKELRGDVMSLDEAQKSMDELIVRLRNWGLSNQTPVELTKEAMAVYPKAKLALIAKGRPPAQVDAMPVSQVLLLHSAEEFFRVRDDVFKWAVVGFPEGYDQLNAAVAAVRELKQRGDVLSVVAEVMPSPQKSYQARIRPERRFAMLRIVEAIRWHASLNDGKAPAKLSDVTVAPLPLDPMTGKPFEYRVIGNRYTLVGPSPDPTSPYLKMVYEVTLKP